ncbi:MAG: AI-2E family transporter [Gammaproteobacteria bacterium HGW-Gammaproteobacteria-3]|nr:MAG: AI-2E family transporter [Gammaproteobacteria bacterium HGW-Gammaproteobacteria-3]
MTTENDFPDLRFFKNKLKRILPNSQAVALLIIILVSFILIITLADLLMPVFASVVLAYLLDGLVEKSVRLNMPRLPAVYLFFFGFLTCLGFLIFILLPMLSEQAVGLVQHIPEIIKRAQKEIMRLPEMYPQFISENRIREMVLAVQRELLTYGQNALSFSAASVIGLVSALVYLFLVPMMVFFFLKDKAIIVNWFLQFMPRDRHLTQSVWKEVDMQIGNYVRGKFAEVIILMAISYVTFSAMKLNYAILLSVLMGLSVIIPYVGATLVTFPVLGIAYFQWGLGGDEFMYIVIAYSVIQALDGVVLVPLLFSEAVNLHPIAIIVAILFFGGMWGFWGVFFAIPLATVVKAVLTAWPRIGETNADMNY